MADHQFTIVVNGSSFGTDAHELSGLQIKALANVPVDYELFQVEGTNSKPIANEQSVHIHEKEEFRAIPAGTFGA